MAWINKPKRKQYTVKYKTYAFHDNDCNKYYNSYRNLRNWYVQQHPLDELDLMNDIYTPTEHVHHIYPILQGKNDDERMLLSNDVDNLIAVSEHNHKLIHNHLDKLTNEQREYLTHKYKVIHMKLINYRTTNKYQ